MDAKTCSVVVDGKPVGAISADSIKVEERLRQLEIGGIASYDELSKLANCDIRARRNIVYSAAKRLEEDGIVVGCVPKVGWKRLAAAEGVDTLDGMSSSIRHKAKKIVRRVDAVGVLNLPAEGQQKACAFKAFGIVVQKMTRPKEIDKLGEISRATGDMDAIRLLKAYGKA
jgi:DNA-binding Lrp family transcriptional regulator